MSEYAIPPELLEGFAHCCPKCYPYHGGQSAVHMRPDTDNYDPDVRRYLGRCNRCGIKYATTVDVEDVPGFEIKEATTDDTL